MESPAGEQSLSVLLDEGNAASESSSDAEWTWASAVAKLMEIVRVVKYERLAAVWDSAQVEAVLVDLLTRLLKHEAEDDVLCIAEHVVLVLRDRIVREPAKSSLCLATLLQLLLNAPSSDPSLPVLALHCCAAAGQRSFSALSLVSPSFWCRC
eukprot:3762254-Rhodomonas_salina.1